MIVYTFWSFDNHDVALLFCSCFKCCIYFLQYSNAIRAVDQDFLLWSAMIIQTWNTFEDGSKKDGHRCDKKNVRA